MLSSNDTLVLMEGKTTNALKMLKNQNGSINTKNIYVSPKGETGSSYSKFSISDVITELINIKQNHPEVIDEFSKHTFNKDIY